MLHVGNLQGQFLKAMDQYLFLLWFSNLPKYLRVGFIPFSESWGDVGGGTQVSAQGRMPILLQGDSGVCVLFSSPLMAPVLSCHLIAHWVLKMTEALQEVSFKWWFHEMESDIYLCVACWSMCQCAMRTEKDLVFGMHTQNECLSHRAPAPLPSSRSDFISADLQQKGQELQGTLTLLLYIIHASIHWMNNQKEFCQIMERNET